MKKFLFFIFAFVFSCPVFSQVFLLQEFFDGSSTLPATWTTIDQDGDGHNWHVFRFDAIGYAVSDSWMAGNIGALMPDNYLVSPQINLNGFSGTIKLRYTIQIPDPDFFAEHYKVAVSVTDNEASDFTNIVKEETCTADDYYEIYPFWHQRIVDLTPFIGQKIYLAWVHYNCTQYQLLLDSIQVSYSTDVPVANLTQAGLRVYPNPANERLTVTGDFINAKIQLYNMDGRLVYQTNKANKVISINVTDIESGVYMLKIKTQNDLITQKVNVSH